MAVCGACEKAARPVDRDALWQLAPDNAMVSIVVAPGALARLEGGFTAVRALLARAPDLASLDREVTALETKLRGPLSLEAVGLDAHGGAALFIVEGREGRNGQEPILIVPVRDRSMLVRIIGGTRKGDLDVIDDLTCKVVQRVYACARAPALLDRLGQGRVPALLARVGARGDIEAFTHPAGRPAMAVTVQLARGGLTLHAAAERPPLQRLANAKPRVEAGKTAGFAVGDIGSLIGAFGDVPPKPIITGVTLDALVKSFAGPATLTIANSAKSFDARLPLHEATVAQKVLDHCDQITSFATARDRRCHLSVPQFQLAVDAWIDASTLHVGLPDAAPDAVTDVTVPLSPGARTLATGEWAVAILGRGTMFAPFAIPREMFVEKDLLGFRVLTVFNEIGVGIRVDGDLATIRTLWSNPDEVIAMLSTLEVQAALTGDGAAGKAIAVAAPASPFAADYHAGMLGLFMPVALLGLVQEHASVTIRDYLKW